MNASLQKYCKTLFKNNIDFHKYVRANFELTVYYNIRNTKLYIGENKGIIRRGVLDNIKINIPNRTLTKCFKDYFKDHEI